eukprot:2700805-Amphidinium_carterae.1
MGLSAAMSINTKAKPLPAPQKDAGINYDSHGRMTFMRGKLKPSELMRCRQSITMCPLTYDMLRETTERGLWHDYLSV